MAELKARPTIYKGVKMRSRLEAGFAQWLDFWSLDWEYEPCAFGSSAGQYLPDFLLAGLPCAWTTNAVDRVYVEVKPDSTSIETMDSVARRMAVIWDSEPNAELVIARPNAVQVVRMDSSEPVRFNLVWVVGHDGIGLAAVAAYRPWQGQWWVAD